MNVFESRIMKLCMSFVLSLVALFLIGAPATAQVSSGGGNLPGSTDPARVNGSAGTIPRGSDGSGLASSQRGDTLAPIDTAASPMGSQPESNPASSSQPRGAANPSQSGTGASNDIRSTLITGLSGVDLQRMTLEAGDIVGIESVVAADQIPSLVSMLDADSALRTRADELTEQLRGRGILPPGERIVGFQNGKLIKMSKAGQVPGAVPGRDAR